MPSVTGRESTKSGLGCVNDKISARWEKFSIERCVNEGGLGGQGSLVTEVKSEASVADSVNSELAERN